MAVFKCKMCGGAIEINATETIGVCEYCGTKQTLPRLDDEKKINLYDRANHFRRNNDYDKAMGIYEQILNEDNTDAESYWSLVLCKYGIEYVEDPSTHKRVPTINRAQYMSVFSDEDYKSALKYADGYQKDIYESEAKAIDEIQKGILEISQKEEPFDIFICYKETGNDGRRTPDSVLATELYHELTREGFKVFFSRITLEDKLGQEYEPYIFAALNSSKVMVVLGTKQEYFNAVWVKNEWSRFLALIKKGKRKTLIPAYKDMDPYDLPEEFSHLQAQDMSKLGFMSDLVRGINKIISADVKEPTRETVVINNGNIEIEPLLKRAFIFLEDSDWENADHYCERVLDSDPENPNAYLGKMMVELKVRKQDDLIQLDYDFSENKQFAKVIRYANDTIKDELMSIIKSINDRKCEEIYKKAVELTRKISTMEEANAVEHQFSLISEYKDSKEIMKKCHDIGVAKETELALTRYSNMLDNALTPYEISKVVTEISGNSNSDLDKEKISAFIDKHRDEYSDRLKLANSLFNDYIQTKKDIEIAQQQITPFMDDIITIKNELKDISKRVGECNKLLGEQAQMSKAIDALKVDYEKVEQEANKIESEITKLSAFSLKQKKEKNTQLRNLLNGLEKYRQNLEQKQKEAENVRAHLSRIGTKESLQAQREHLQNTLTEKKKIFEDAKKSSGVLELNEKLTLIQAKIALPKYLITLLVSQDKEAVSKIISDETFLYVVKQNYVLQKALSDNPVFNSLPNEIKDKLKKAGKQTLDIEAIYYQACQALDFGNGKSDVVWAKEQFLKIKEYKDSEERIHECNKKIAGI